MEQDNRFKRVLKKMLVLDANGLNEFDKIYHNVSRIEKKKVKLDYELCKDLVNVNGSTVPLITHMKSREVLRDIVTFMNEEE